MHVRLSYLFAVLLLFPFGAGVIAQSYPVSRSSPVNSRPASPPAEDLGSVLRQLKTGLADLKNTVNNHEIEIRTFEDKLRNQESSAEHLQQQVRDDLKSNRDGLRTATLNLEGKIDSTDQTLQNLDMSLNNTVKGVIADLRQLKTQANESVVVLGQYKQKLIDLEKLLEAQNQHMQNYELALQSMMEVIQAQEISRKETAKMMSKERDSQQNNDDPNVYKVQPGDSLDKIARAHKVSVQALQEANQLTNDKIRVGQKLKIP